MRDAPIEPLVRYLHSRGAGESDDLLRALLGSVLEMGQCLLLFDGLDEVEVPSRPRVASWIERLAATFRRCRIVVTSRVVGYHPLELPNGAEVTLQPFAAEQVEDYVRAWHRAVHAWELGSAHGLDAHEAAAAEHEADALLRALGADAHLRALAATPLMLSAMVLIRRSEGRLPAHRIQVYQVLARALCETWSEARRLVPRDAPAPVVDYDAEALPLLGRIAFWIHSEHSSGLAPAEALRTEMAAALRGIPSVPADQADAATARFLAALSEEAQVLVPRGPDHFGFLHRTFEEYFAAAHLCGRDELGDFARRRWHEPHWQEVVVLGVGTVAMLQARPQAAGRLIDAMLRGTWRVKGHPWVTGILRRNVLLAARAAAAAPNVAADTRARVATAYTSLLLDDFDGAIGREARRALRGMAGSALAADVLQALTVEAERGVLRAVSALGEAGDVRGTGVLIDLMRSHPVTRIRAAAARALGALGDKEATPALLEVFANDAGDVDVRNAAAQALHDLGDDRVRSAMLEAVRAGPLRLRSGAARCLGRMGNQEVVDTLWELLGDPASDQELRIGITYALANMAGVPALRQLLRHGDVTVRSRAAWFAGLMRGSEAEQVALEVIRSDELPEVRAQAAAALVAFDAAPRREVLVEALRAERDSRVAVQLAELLGRGGDRECLTVIRVVHERFRGSSAEVFMQLALARLGDDEAFKSLVGLLAAGDESERSTAAWALGELRDPRALGPLLEVVAGAAPDFVATSAIESLGRLGEPAAVPPLVAKHDEVTSPDVRGAVRSALWSLYGAVFDRTAPVTLRRRR
jgi:HEAT repeat protein